MAFLENGLHFSSAPWLGGLRLEKDRVEHFLCNSTALISCYLILMKGAGVIFGGRWMGEAAAGMASPVLVYICGGHFNGRMVVG